MRILFAGGGTLGSVTPLLAVAEELQGSMFHVPCSMMRWIGTRRGPERKLVEEAGIKFSWIWAPKWRRYFDARNVFTPLLLCFSVVRALLLLLKLSFVRRRTKLSFERPDVIVTAGGYVGVPLVWAAWWLRRFGVRIPVLLHNQDVRWSLANKLVAPFVKRITYVLPGTVPRWWRKKAVWTGNPVREFIREGDKDRGLKMCGFDGGAQRTVLQGVKDSPLRRPTVLVIGGGTGARRLNEIVAEALPDLTRHYQVIHITGRGKGNAPPPQSSPTRGEEDQGTSPPLVGGVGGGGHDYYRSFDFVTHEIADLYAAADLVITRAGMGVLSELAALGKPMIIVPIPGSHQEDNARYFEKKRAAIVLDQKKLTGASLMGTVEKLMGELGTIQEMSERARELARPDAAKRAAHEILSIDKR